MKKPAGLVPSWVQIPPPAIYEVFINILSINMAERILIGRVTHYYPKIGVAVFELQQSLRKGDKIEIEGKTTKLAQTVTSMQLNHVDINVAESGQSIGLKVEGGVREGDKVYKLVE